MKQRLFVMLAPFTLFLHAECLWAARCAGGAREWEHHLDLRTSHMGANVIVLTLRGNIFWNDKQIGWDQLKHYLGSVRELPMAVLTVFRPDARAPCNLKLRVRRLMEQKLNCSTEGYCDEGPSWSGAGKSRGPTI